VQLLGDFNQIIKTKRALQNILISLPKNYRANRQFINCTMFLEHDKLELALESLIELTCETDSTFSEEFWLRLAACADAISLQESAEYCRQQILS